MSTGAWQALVVAGILVATACWLARDIRKAQRRAKADVEKARRRAKQNVEAATKRRDERTETAP